MSEHQESYPIVTMCRVLGVSPSGYYAWRQRPPSARVEEDAQLRSRIERIHGWSRGTYGAPRIRAELADEGQRVSRKRVARLMKEAGVQGVSRRRRTRTTHREPGSGRAPDRVNRNFTAHRPDQLWVADITYIGTWAGFLYLAVVVDAFSRRVVGWAMATHLRTELVIDALNMEGFYNPHRRHSSLENHSPASYERRYDQASAVVGTVGECKVCSVNETAWFPSGKSSVLYSLVKSNLSRNPKADMMAIRLSIFGLLRLESTR